jgi:hypothetical protein
MRKSLLLLVMALSFSTAICAQNVMMAPAGMDLPDNQKLLGHYDTDDVGTEGVGLSTNGLVYLGTILESEELDLFNGGRIMSFRVGLAESTTISKVFVMPVAAGGAYGTLLSWDCNVSEVGWNVIELPTPYQLNLSEGEKLMIGFQYEQKANQKPLALVKVGDIYDTYQYKKAGSMYRWAVAGLKPYGNLCVQCIVEHDNFPKYLIKPGGFDCPEYVKVGETMPFSFFVRNRGNNAVEPQALTFDVMVDGNKVATITNQERLEAGDTITIQSEIETADLEMGNHEISVENAVIEDEVLQYVFPMKASFLVHNGIYPRQKHLIEQLTSTYCTYCPLGNSMLNILKGQRDDIIWVGLHGNLGSGVDPYTTAQGDSIMIYMTGGSISYPSAAFDRSTGWENDLQMVNGIGYYEQYHQQIANELSLFFDDISANQLTFASIEINPVVNRETREAVVTVSGEMSPDFDLLLGEGCKLTVYITEDSLVARQLNSGTWVNNYRHNGVFRCALGSAKGVDFNLVEEGYSNEFKFTVPAEWNMANLNVVAFISRPLTNGASGVYTDMKVNNAESVRLISEEGGIEEILNEGDAVPVAYYDMMGRQHDNLQQGVNIVKMSDGTARKVLVK